MLNSKSLPTMQYSLYSIDIKYSCGSSKWLFVKFGLSPLCKLFFFTATISSLEILGFSHFELFLELLLSETDHKLINTQASFFEPACPWIPMRLFTQLRDIKSDRSSFHRRSQFQTFNLGDWCPDRNPGPGLPDGIKITLEPYSE